MGLPSGKTEPTWIASKGALVYEDVLRGQAAAPTYAPPTTTVPPAIDERYSNPGGTRPRTDVRLPE